MKKVLSVTLASAMAVVTLAGCGGGNSAQQTTAAETAATTAAGATEAAGSTKTGGPGTGYDPVQLVGRRIQT